MATKTAQAKPKNQAGVAQLVEPAPSKPMVAGSSPAPRSNASKPKPPGRKQGLNTRQRAFVAEYIKDSNATKAAIRAGYSEGPAGQIGFKLLKNAQISAEIEQGREQIVAQVTAETGITLERTLREIAKGAFHDPRKFFNATGGLRPVLDLDDATAAALAGFEVAEIKAGEGLVIGETKKIKIADRKGYLDMLMKHLGGYKKDNDQGAEAAAKALAGLAVRFVEAKP